MSKMDAFAIAAQNLRPNPEVEQALADTLKKINEQSVAGIETIPPKNPEEDDRVYKFVVDGHELQITPIPGGLKMNTSDNTALWHSFKNSPSTTPSLISFLVMVTTLNNGAIISNHDPVPFPGEKYTKAECGPENAESTVNFILGTFMGLYGKNLDIGKQPKTPAQPLTPA